MWDCNSTLQGQHWPLAGAVAGHPTHWEVPNSQLWLARGRQSQTALLIPPSPHWVSHPTVKPTTNRSPLATETTAVTVRGTKLSKQQEAIWDGKTLWPCCILLCAGGTVWKIISYLTPNASPFLCLCSVIFQTGMTEALEPEGTPWLLAPGQLSQGSVTSPQWRLQREISRNTLKANSFGQTAVLTWLCAEKWDYSESGFKWGSFLVWSRCAVFWCHLTF